MTWPVGLKQRVREVAGNRGVTRFVLAAVEAKLAEATEGPAELLVEQVEQVDAVPATFDAATQNERTARIEQDYQLQRASTLQTPDSAAPTAESGDNTHCPTCHAPLINGECWTCAM